MSLVADGRTGAGAMDLYDGVLRVRDADGALLHDGVDVQHYLDLIEEAVEPWTYMKFPYLRAPRARHGLVPRGSAGAGAQLRAIPSPRAEASASAFVAHGPVHGTLAYHWARMIEMLHAMEVIAELLQDDALLGGA
jgi:NAD-reducing hydrogenase large subunit